MNSITDLRHYIGIQETNLLTNVLNAGEGFALIEELSHLFTDSTKLNDLDDKNLKLPVFLYMNSSAELNFSMASCLRLNRSHAFIGLRVAIDCALTADYLMRYPDKRDVYLYEFINDEEKRQDNEKEWKKVFLNIKNTIRKDITSFPHARGLVKIHELCSKLSHADALGIMHRYSEGDGMLSAKFFDYDDTVEEFNAYLAVLLLGFFEIYQMFWIELFKGLAGEKANEVASVIEVFKLKILAFQKKYPLGE
jgi:hypothetical protein